MSDAALPCPADLLLRAIVAERDFFRAIDEYLRPATVWHPAGAGISEKVTRFVEEGLRPPTIRLMEALDAAHAEARRDWEPLSRALVEAFEQRAREWIGAWGWDWAFRPDRHDLVHGIRRRFEQEVERPLMEAAVVLYRASGDIGTIKAVRWAVDLAAERGYEPRPMSIEEARKVYDGLLTPYHHAAIYGPARPGNREDLFLELADYDRQLGHFVGGEALTIGVHEDKPRRLFIKLHEPARLVASARRDPVEDPRESDSAHGGEAACGPSTNPQPADRPGGERVGPVMLGDEPLNLEVEIDRAMAQGMTITTLDRCFIEQIGQIRDWAVTEHLAHPNSLIRYVRRVPIRKYHRREVPVGTRCLDPAQADGWRIGFLRGDVQRDSGGDRALVWRWRTGPDRPPPPDLLIVESAPDIIARNEDFGALEPLACWAALAANIGLARSFGFLRVDIRDVRRYAPGPELLLFEMSEYRAAQRFADRIRQFTRQVELLEARGETAPPKNLLDFALHCANTIPDQLPFGISCYYAPVFSDGDIRPSERRWRADSSAAWLEGELDWPEGDYFICADLDARSCFISMLDFFLRLDALARRLLAKVQTGPPVGLSRPPTPTVNESGANCNESPLHEKPANATAGTGLATASSDPPPGTFLCTQNALARFLAMQPRGKLFERLKKQGIVKEYERVNPDDPRSIFWASLTNPHQHRQALDYFKGGPHGPDGDTDERRGSG